MSSPFHSSPDGMQIKERLFALETDVRRSLEAFAAETGGMPEQGSVWLESLDLLRNELTEETFRVAVIGSVKAGKSTFVNYLLGRDLLKRGAGIITSVVTRVIDGPELSATLTLKGIALINAEMNSAVMGLESTEFLNEQKGFDIREESHRRRLAQLLDDMSKANAGVRNGENRHWMLLNAYLSGYPAISGNLLDGENILVLDAAAIEEHRDFVSDESRAVFLRELVLTVPSSGIPPNVEFGDCQGVDSPNPNHMAAVLDYLLRSHLAVYLVSLRTGIREADVKLINVLKTLRLDKRALFVLNVDLGEIDTIDQLEGLMARTAATLSQMGLDPALYGFSGLYALLKTMEAARDEKLEGRDHLRLQFWEEATELLAFSHAERERFEVDLRRIVEQDRYRLGLDRAFSLLNRVLRNMHDYAAVRLHVQGKDVESLRKLYGELEKRQNEMRATLDLVRSSLRNLGETIKKELAGGVDGFFDRSAGTVVRDLLEFIERFEPTRPQSVEEAPEPDEDNVMRKVMGFHRELNERFSRYINDEINLRIIDYARSREEEIEVRFQEQAQTYVAVMERLFDSYAGEVRPLIEGFAPPERVSFSLRPPGDDLRVPLFSSAIEYEYSTRAQVMLMVGMEKTLTGARRLARKMLKRPDEGNDGSLSFDKGVAVIKKHAVQKLQEHILDYRENFKYLYLFKLVDRIGQSLVREIEQYVQGNLVDFEELLRLAETEGHRKEEMKDLLARFGQSSASLLSTLVRLHSERNSHSASVTPAESA